MFAYCNNNPVNCEDQAGTHVSCSVMVYDGGGSNDDIDEKRIIYDVPCLNQGQTNLCWAYCIFMRKCYDAGEELSESQKMKVVESWGFLYRTFYHHNFGLPFALQGKRVSMYTIYDLYYILKDNGPVYATYKIPFTTAGHVVLVTGVDIEKGLVYTNNPWGESGSQSFVEFCDGFFSENCKVDSRYQLSGIYIPEF